MGIVSKTSTAAMGVLLSGGLDSCILLAHLLEQGEIVQPFYVRSNLVWEQFEVAAVNSFSAAVASPRLRGLVTLEMPLDDLYDGHWSITGRDTPDADSPDEAVYLPGRNALLLVKAAVWCQLHGIDHLALAPLGTSPFADASADFFDNFEAALNCGSRRPLRIIRPFSGLDKRRVMQLGGRYPLELTFSCISPREGFHCGLCNKCAERQAAFRAASMDDPTRYAGAAAAVPGA